MDEVITLAAILLSRSAPIVTLLVPPATLLFALLLLFEAIRALRKSQPCLTSFLKSVCYFVFFLKLLLL
jgi:hypothetical protein